ncbi:MAG: DUF4465 domain-containing protein [Luteolibacter sp.]
MKNEILGASAIAAALALTLGSASAAVVTFETVPLSSGYYNGSDQSGGVVLDGAKFNNNYNATFGSWSGFAVSNQADTTTPGYFNQYSSYSGGGAAGSANYAVGYYSTYETATTNVILAGLTDLAGKGAFFTNTTYTALDMLNGGDFGSKKFGGASGNDADWLLLTIQGYAAGLATGTTVNFYLADFRFADNSQDYIVNDWRSVDFSPLGTVDEIRFSMTSSDNDAFGTLTPTYFAMDNFSAVPEPSSLLISLCGFGLLVRRKR